MRALFKPEDGNVLLVRDADFNESTLLRNFSNKVKNGAVIEVQERNTGVNDLLTGLVFTVKDSITPVPTPSYISTNSTVKNSLIDLPLFSIEVKADNENYTLFKYDTDIWAVLKLNLESLGLTDVTITSNGLILGNNETSSVISGSITLPKGLFQFVNRVDASVYNFNDDQEIVLGE